MSCPGPGYFPIIDGSTLWLSGSTTDHVPALFQLDASMQPVATITMPEPVLAMAPATHKVIDQTVLNGTRLRDGPVPAASIAIVGHDVWVSIANGPTVVAHYQRDGTLEATVPLSSPRSESGRWD